jgi:hypothetical protein
LVKRPSLLYPTVSDEERRFYGTSTSSLAASTSSVAEVDGRLEAGGRFDDVDDDGDGSDASEVDVVDELDGMVRHMFFTCVENKTLSVFATLIS